MIRTVTCGESVFTCLLFTLNIFLKLFKILQSILLVLFRWENKGSQVKYLLFKDIDKPAGVRKSF